MKKTIRILCSFVCLLSLVALVFTSCNFGAPIQNTTPADGTTEGNSPAVTTPSETTAPGNDSPIDPLGKKIPIYQGMSISTSAGITMPSFGSGGAALRKSENNGNTDNNGNHYGWYKGDSTDDKDDVDQETPFPDADENIEQEIKDSLEVIGSKQDIYYATQNQNVYIHIYIDNPDQFEILSFTLNGQKYSSYMFEKGSTQELLILEYNVGDVSGIVEYTIDQIKYIDGTEIKDVKIGGDQTVKAGIRTENQVTATVTNLQIGTNSVSFNAIIADKDDLIAYNNGVIKAVLFDGDALLAEKELTLGSNTVTFDGLKNGTVYQYAIVACYDNLTGEEIGFHVLSKQAFQTNNIVLFDNIVIGQDNISFTFKWDESVSNKMLNSLKLYKGGELATTLEANAATVSGLLSANEYVLVAEYQDLGQPATISLTFATLEKGVPGISIINPTQTQTSVGFEIVETDVDNVGAITKIELVHANGTVEAENVDVRSFADLLSNNTYTVKITYTYDLNDGKGEQTLTAEANITTLAKTAPQFVISNEKATSGNITADYTFTDVDSVLASYKVELYKGETLIAQNSENIIDFTGLDYLVDYTITITYTYDLNDGKGVQTATATKVVKMASTGFAYTVNADGTTCTITGMGTCTDTIVVVPDTIDGYKVTAIGEAAFAENYSITFFQLPDTIYSIGKRAFYKCTEITEITIPESVWEIDTQIFLGCNKLTTVYYNGRYGNQENSFLNTQSIETVVFGGKYVPNYVAYGATNIKTVIILDGVTSIDWGAFDGCTSLTSVTISNSVTSFSYDTFARCSSLTSIDIPASVTKFGSQIFDGCSSLTSIVIPQGATSITWGMFRGCSSLTSITIPDSVTSIGGQSFYNCSSLTSISIPSNVTSIDFDAFYNCTSLTSIVIPQGVTSISSTTFSDCSSLISIIIPDSVTSIGSGAFYRCESLTNIIIPEGVTTIGAHAFGDCASLTSITIPYGVTKIEESTFSFCTNLTTITIPDSVTSIDDLAFLACYSLANIIIGEDNPNYSVIDNIIYDKSVTKFILIPKGLSGSVTIPDSITSIGDYAFEYCKKLTNIVIPNSVTSIGNSAFENCSSLTSITIPDSVASIGSSAFSWCKSLESITILARNINFGSYPFSVCNNITSFIGPIEALSFSKTNLVTVVLTSGTSIPDYLFEGNESLQSITIPESVTSIGTWAFYYNQSLTTITFKGTVDQWKAIALGIDWNLNVPATEVICSDGTVTLS